MTFTKFLILPRFMDIWHPDEDIGLSTIESAVKIWAKKHLTLENCEIEIQNVEPFEDSFKSFKEHEEFFTGGSTVEVKFEDRLIQDLSQLWKMSKEDVLKRLNSSIL